MISLSDSALSTTFPRLFILMKWISCVIALSFWAWCFWPRYCCTCCCQPFARVAWNHLLKPKEWAWQPPLLLLFPLSMSPFTLDSFLGTLHCSSEKLYLLMQQDDRYYQGELYIWVWCVYSLWISLLNHLYKSQNATNDSKCSLFVLLPYTFNIPLFLFFFPASKIFPQAAGGPSAWPGFHIQNLGRAWYNGPPGN